MGVWRKRNWGRKENDKQIELKENLKTQQEKKSILMIGDFFVCFFYREDENIWYKTKGAVKIHSQ